MALNANNPRMVRALNRQAESVERSQSEQSPGQMEPGSSNFTQMAERLRLKLAQRPAPSDPQGPVLAKVSGGMSR